VGIFLGSWSLAHHRLLCSQHNLAVRVCDILRNTKPMSAEQHASQSVAPSPPAGSTQAPSPDAKQSQFGGLKRKDTAVRLTHALLEREFEAQQQRRGSVITKVAIVTKASTQAPPRALSRKSAAAYAEELEALVGTCLCLTAVTQLKRLEQPFAYSFRAGER